MITPTWRCLCAKRVRDARVGLVPNIFGEAGKSIFSTYIFFRLYNISYRVSSDTYIYVQLNNLYLPHRKLSIRNFQPIYNTVQHIFSDTTYILVFNTFVTLGVPYTVKGHKFRRWKTNAGNTPGKTKRFFVFKSLLCLPLINGCLITSRMARNINNHSYFYKKKTPPYIFFCQVEIRKSTKFHRTLCKLMVIWELERAKSSIEMQIESSAWALAYTVNSLLRTPL